MTSTSTSTRCSLARAEATARPRAAGLRVLGRIPRRGARARDRRAALAGPARPAAGGDGQNIRPGELERCGHTMRLEISAPVVGRSNESNGPILYFREGGAGNSKRTVDEGGAAIAPNRALSALCRESGIGVWPRRGPAQGSTWASPTGTSRAMRGRWCTPPAAAGCATHCISA